MGVNLSAKFVGPEGRRLFRVAWRPVRDTGRCVLLVPAFGDEMNKSRHMLSRTASALAEQGLCAVLADPYGTGDSDGEFRAATWERWMDDLGAVGADLKSEGLTIEALLCMRTGAMLGCAAARRAGWPVKRTVLWQPVTQGSRFLVQFLRLRVAATLGESRTESAADLKKRLDDGETLEIAGYDLSTQLAQQLNSASLLPMLDASAGEIVWFDVVPEGDEALPASSAEFIERARSQGATLTASAVPGEPFWTSAELAQVPELVARTVRALAVPL